MKSEFMDGSCAAGAQSAARTGPLAAMGAGSIGSDCGLVSDGRDKAPGIVTAGRGGMRPRVFDAERIFGKGLSIEEVVGKKAELRDDAELFGARRSDERSARNGTLRGRRLQRAG